MHDRAIGTIRYPVIVLEGADSSGKTTLANALRDLAGARVIHMTYRFKGHMHLYQRAAMELALKLAESSPVVMDRWWPSDVVYSEEFRGGSRDSQLGYRLHDRVAQRYGFIYVFCCPGDVVQHRRRHARRNAAGGEMYSTLGILPERYLAMSYSMGHREDTHFYDMDQWDPRDFAEVMFEVACDHLNSLYEPQFRDCALSREISDRFFAGNPAPEVLLVGSMRNPEDRGRYCRRESWPLCEVKPLHPHGSTFLQALSDAGVEEDKLGFMNTHGCADAVVTNYLVCRAKNTLLLDQHLAGVIPAVCTGGKISLLLDETSAVSSNFVSNTVDAVVRLMKSGE